MSTQDSTNPSPTASQSRTRPAENDQVMKSMAARNEDGHLHWNHSAQGQ
jgi:hypothetical protein